MFSHRVSNKLVFDLKEESDDIQTDVEPVIIDVENRRLSHDLVAAAPSVFDVSPLHEQIIIRPSIDSPIELRGNKLHVSPASVMHIEELKRAPDVSLLDRERYQHLDSELLNIADAAELFKQNSPTVQEKLATEVESFVRKNSGWIKNLTNAVNDIDDFDKLSKEELERFKQMLDEALSNQAVVERFIAGVVHFHSMDEWSVDNIIELGKHAELQISYEALFRGDVLEDLQLPSPDGEVGDIKTNLQNLQQARFEAEQRRQAALQEHRILTPVDVTSSIPLNENGYFAFVEMYTNSEADELRSILTNYQLEDSQAALEVFNIADEVQSKLQDHFVISQQGDEKAMDILNSFQYDGPNNVGALESGTADIIPITNVLHASNISYDKRWLSQGDDGLQYPSEPGIYNVTEVDPKMNNILYLTLTVVIVESRSDELMHLDAPAMKFIQMDDKFRNLSFAEKMDWLESQPIIIDRFDWAEIPPIQTPPRDIPPGIINVYVYIHYEGHYTSTIDVLTLSRKGYEEIVTPKSIDKFIKDMVNFDTTLPADEYPRQVIGWECDSPENVASYTPLVAQHIVPTDEEEIELLKHIQYKSEYLWLRTSDSRWYYEITDLEAFLKKTAFLNTLSESQMTAVGPELRQVYEGHMNTLLRDLSTESPWLNPAVTNYIGHQLVGDDDIYRKMVRRYLPHEVVSAADEVSAGIRKIAGDLKEVGGQQAADMIKDYVPKSIQQLAWDYVDYSHRLEIQANAISEISEYDAQINQLSEVILESKTRESQTEANQKFNAAVSAKLENFIRSSDRDDQDLQKLLAVVNRTAQYTEGLRHLEGIEKVKLQTQQHQLLQLGSLQQELTRATSALTAYLSNPAIAIDEVLLTRQSYLHQSRPPQVSPFQYSIARRVLMKYGVNAVEVKDYVDAYDIDVDTVNFINDVIQLADIYINQKSIDVSSAADLKITTALANTLAQNIYFARTGAFSERQLNILFDVE